MDREASQAIVHRGYKELDTTERQTLFHLGLNTDMFQRMDFP